jgi:MFS family permease
MNDRVRVFYGWWVVAASFVILLVTVGVGLYVPPVFLVPLQEEFGWSRAAISAGGAIAALVIGVFSPLAGAWVDRYGARRVMVAGAVVMGGAFASLGMIRSLWHLYTVNVVAAAGTACVAWIPNQTLVPNWCEKRRGTARGIALAGIGFGGLLMSPFADVLIDRLGWRLAYALLGGLVLVLVVAAILALVRSRPADLGLWPDGVLPVADPDSDPLDEPTPAEGLDLPDTLRSGAFWIFSLVNLLSVFASISVVMHLVAFLRDSGFESGTAASVLGLTVGASVPGRLLFGFLADRFSKNVIMSAAMIIYAGAMLCLFDIRAGFALPLFVLLFGGALGGAAVLVPLLVGECFGLRSFGKILGLAMIAATLGAAAGPILTGRIFDVTGSYRLAFVMHTVSFAVAAVAILWLRAPRRG